MGSGESHIPQDIKNEKVTGAGYYTCSKQGSIPGMHHGAVLETDKGNRYLLDNNPQRNAALSPASEMNSRDWKLHHKIDVVQPRTVGEVFERAGGNYFTAPFCVGTAERAEVALNPPKAKEFRDELLKLGYKHEF